MGIAGEDFAQRFDRRNYSICSLMKFAYVSSFYFAAAAV